MPETKKKETGLAIYKGPDYEIMKRPAEDLKEIFAANVSGEGVDEFDLDRVNIPGGGGLSWTVADLDGQPKPYEELVGIPVLHGDRRAYWEESFDASGGGSPPDCASLDCRNGIGFIRGDQRGENSQPIVRECKTCQMSQWGSADPGNKEDNQQACSHRKLVFLIREEDMLPLVIDLAPTSVKPFSRFLLRLAGKGVACYGAVIGLKLINETSSNGIKYSVVSPRLVAKLTPEQSASSKAFSEAIKPLFEKTGVESPKENGGPRSDNGGGYTEVVSGAPGKEAATDVPY